MTFSAEEYEAHATAHIKNLGQAIRCAATLDTLATTTLPHGVSAFQITELDRLVETHLSQSLYGFEEADRQLRTLRLLTRAKARRISSKQIVLLHIGAKKMRMGEPFYRSLLHRIGHVETASDLDQAAFDWLLCLFAEAGCELKRQPAPAEQTETFGKRANMASPAQIELIQSLWSEWTRSTGAGRSADLNVWLSRYHRVSALRFVDTAKAGKVINALRSMVARKADQASA